MVKRESSQEGNSVANESSTLLGTNGDDGTNVVVVSSRGEASLFDTILNLSKTCMGTGVLALPYAAKQGGILLYTIGLFLICIWNVYSVQRLCHCLELLPNNPSKNPTSLEDEEEELSIIENNNNDDNEKVQVPPPPPQGTTTFGKVAWYALGGRIGLYFFDTSMMILFIGIIVAYMNAIRSFLDGIIISSTTTTDNNITSEEEYADNNFNYNDFCIILLMTTFIGLFSMVPDLGYLAKISAAGLSILLATILIVAFYGIIDNFDNNNNEDVATTYHYNWLPENGFSGISNWFGCVVFSYGVVPLTYNYRESMKNPTKMVDATLTALCSVAMLYIIIGIGLYYLYDNIQNDILRQLPTSGVIPIVTRVSMIVVVLSSVPLLIVPCAELIEGKIFTTDNKNITTGSFCQRALLRLGLCFICAAISTFVPNFVNVLSFVGCCCVAMISFVFPPAFHIRLLLSSSKIITSNTDSKSIALDIAMLVLGILTSVASSYIIFKQITSS